MATPTSGLVENPFWCFPTVNEDTDGPPLGASRHASDVLSKNGYRDASTDRTTV